MPKNLSKRFLQVGLVGSVLFAATAHAHYPWLMASNFAPAQDRAATVYLTGGHNFPIETLMDSDRIGSVEIVSPDGKRSALESNGTAIYSTPELGQGVHVVLASQKAAFFTRTKQGSKRQSKEGLSDVIRCSYSSNNMKAILTVGEGKSEMGKQFDQPLEIVPLTNPAELKVGDYMDVQVTMRGEPYGGMVFATYSGFSTEGAYAYTVEPDNTGKASIRILHTGPWLVRARVEQPYPDTKVCDIEAYTTTLTFAIR